MTIKKNIFLDTMFILTVKYVKKIFLILFKKYEKNLKKRGILLFS